MESTEVKQAHFEGGSEMSEESGLSERMRANVLEAIASLKNSSEVEVEIPSTNGMKLTRAANHSPDSDRKVFYIEEQDGEKYVIYTA